MPAEWPFSDPPNVAVFTTRRVFRSGAPILRVYHDEEDGAWQFHADGPADAADMMIVALEEVLTRDPTIVELHDLPCGWCAERAAAGQAWSRRAHPAA